MKSSTPALESTPTLTSDSSEIPSTSSRLVQNRLHDIVASHECSLSRVTVHSSNSNSAAAAAGAPSIADATELRCYATQPPLRTHGRTSGTNGSSVAEIQLNPPERTAPQNLLQDYHLHSDDIHSALGGSIYDEIGEDHRTDVHDYTDFHKMTIKSISILSTLCDEAEELYTVAQHRFLSQLYLFGHDLKMDDNGGGGGVARSGSRNMNQEGIFGSGNDHSGVDDCDGRGRNGANLMMELDEARMIQRDRELLRRIGKFIKTLQNIHNFVQRCQRLLRNLVCQVYGCLSPMYMPKDHEYGDMNEDTSVLSMGSKTKETTEPSLFRNVENLLPIIEAMAKLLEVLISIDATISNNPELAEAWDLYKSVVMDRDSEDDVESDENGREAGPVYVVDTNAGEEQNVGHLNNQNERTPGADASYGHDEASTKYDHAESSDEKQPKPHSTEDLLKLERMLMQLDFTLLSSRSFLMAIEQNFDPTNEFFQQTTDSQEGNGKRHQGHKNTLHQYMKNSVSLLLSRYKAVIQTKNERNERGGIVGVYGLYCLYRRLLPSNIAPDEKLYRSLCVTLPSICPVIPLFGELPFLPSQFLSRYAPLERAKGALSNIEESKAKASAYLSKHDKSFCAEVSGLYREGLAWIVTAECDLALSDVVTSGPNDGLTESVEKKDTMPSHIAAVDHMLDIVREGFLLARFMKNILRNYLIMHKTFMEPIQSTHLSAIEKLCSMVKSIELFFRGRGRNCIVSIHKAALKLTAFSIFNRLEMLRSYVDHHHGTSAESQGSRMERAQMSRIGASLSVLESLLKGSSTFSPTRLHAIQVAVYACYEEHRDFRSTVNLEEVEHLFHQLELISNIDDAVVEACDCSFLYFHKTLCIPILKQMQSSSRRSDICRIQLVLAAFSDPFNVLLRSSTYLNSMYPTALYVGHFRSYLIERVLLKEIITPIVEDIENTLRHRILSKNIDEMPPMNPKQQQVGNFMAFLELTTLHLCDVSINIKSIVERMLEKSLYNSSTVGLRDTNSHSEMAVIASTYGLNLLDHYLPSGTADQGLDLVPITQDIEAFVSTYNYNMNQQSFVERASNNGCRYLSTVGIDCISMSLRRHGSGIAKATMGSLNEYISEAIADLRTILSNDLFFSSASKEKRWFESEKRSNVVYPFERAVTFRQEIMLVEDSTDRQPLLEKCKILLTKIGNALGLFRLVLCAKQYTTNQTMPYLAPVSNTKDELPNVANDTNLQRCIHSSFQILKECKGSDQSSDTFFHNLSMPITSHMPAADWKHFNSFFILYPALSLSWLDASIRGKDMLRKKIKTSEGYFTDDGFAFGCAFLFESLGQTGNFDSLDWSHSSQHQFAHEKMEIMKKAEKINMATSSSSSLFNLTAEKTERGDDNEMTRLQVSAKRLEMRRREMDFLNCSLGAARMILIGER